MNPTADVNANQREVYPVTLKLNIRADLARLAVSCMAQKDIRYYLNGLRVEPRAEGGAFIVATDGHRLCAVIDETATCSEPVILRIDKAMARLMPKPSPRAQDKSDQRLELHDFLGRPALILTSKESRGLLPEYVVPNALIEGKFPDWRKVIPDLSKLTRGAADSYNPAYLQGTVDAFGKGNWRIDFAPYQAEPQQAIVFHISGHEHVLLIVMPRRAPANPLDVLTEKWTADAMRAKETTNAPAENPVAVPVQRNGKGAGAKPAATRAKAKAPTEVAAA